jgi:hypothetical protein
MMTQDAGEIKQSTAAAREATGQRNDVGSIRLTTLMLTTS